MFDRRQFLKAAALLAAARCIPYRAPAARPTLVNDVHSALNQTSVAEVLVPRDVAELRAIFRATQNPISIAGGRHAMGGQQFATDSTLIDVRGMNRILRLDADRGIVEVEGGIEWPELISGLVKMQEGREKQWGIRQKQTGADRLTVAGALAANAHGRGLTMKPFVGDVESFMLLTANGDLVRCSRDENRELFSLAIGGYGLFGLITSVELRLMPRQKVERVVELEMVENIDARFRERVRDGYLFGDFQFSIDEKSNDFLRRGVFSCYKPVPIEREITATQAELNESDWTKLILLAHGDKAQAFERYSQYYLATTGQVYWSDTHQLATYLDEYHPRIDAALGGVKASEMITEIYVPHSRLADFMGSAGSMFFKNKVNVIYGTVRLIERDDETVLAWAREPWACVIFNLHTVHSPEGIEHSAAAFRALIDLAIERGGSYYLTYHRWASREQVEKCHPRFAEFLAAKRRLDPRERFQSDWYRFYKQMFA